jgi:RecA/RadA recombinase
MSKHADEVDDAEKKRAPDKKKKKHEKAGQQDTMAGITDWAERHVGPGSVRKASEHLPHPLRIPTGIFAVDYMIGGGLPIWGVSGFYGPESGGKTTACAGVVSSVQNTCWSCMNHVLFCSCKSPTLQDAFWVDAEGDLDYDWIKAQGVDLDRLYVAVPETVEQAKMMMRLAIKVPNCGAVILDSLATLVPMVELSEDASYSQQPGTQAVAIGKLVRSFRGDIQQETLKGHRCLGLFTTQIRMKIGQMFGSPESYFAGGWASRHNWSLLLRFSQLSMDAEVAKRYKVDGVDHATLHSVVVKKKKVRIFAPHAKYIRANENIDGLGLRRGQINDFQSIMKFAEEFGLFRESPDTPGKHMLLDLDGVAKKADLKTLFERHPEYYYRTKAAIIIAKNQKYESTPYHVSVPDDDLEVDSEDSL